MTRYLLSVSLVFGLLSPALGGNWPMLRMDAARSGYTADQLPEELSPAWQHRSAHRPQRAWPRSKRQRFDECYQPVIHDGRLFFGSSVDCKLYCLDATTGKPLWSYFTGGPIRFAPVAWQDRVAVASDDGLLHVLNAKSGALVWDHRGGPDRLWRLGNGRMISKWPARGGPVLIDGVLYYAAGIWPSDGIFVYALDASSGRELWSNKDSGGIYMPQPHGGANAKSGLAAQGHLVAQGDRLFIPTGRAVPAALERQTGQLKYFHLQQNRAAGGTAAAVIGDHLFNSGLAFHAQNGGLAAKIGYSSVAEFPGGFVCAIGDEIHARRWVKAVKPDRKGNLVEGMTLQSRWKAAGIAAGSSLIVAGKTVVVGAPGQVTLVDGREDAADKDRMLWKTSVPGDACGLAVADNRLYVSTTHGSIHCFTAQPSRQFSQTPASSPSGSVSRAVAQAAREIIERTGVRDGYCLDLGCGDGQLAYELARRTNLTIIAIDDDPHAVAQARERLAAAGLYGARVTVHEGPLSSTGYPRYFANLIVSARSLAAGSDAVDQAEVDRIMRPFGGVACLGRAGAMQVSRRDQLAGAGGWTHQYANPANTVCSDDSLVSGQLGVLWFRDFDLELPSRHGRGPAPLFHRGRLFHEGLDELRAVDAYNGRELWSYRLSGVLRAYDGDHLMGTAGTGSNFCVSDEGVFVRYRNSCLRIDAEHGLPAGEFVVPGGEQDASWGYVAVEGGKLYGSRADSDHVVSYRYRPGGDMSQQLTESNLLFAYDVESEQLLWQYEAEHSIRHNAIAIGAKYVYLIDRQTATFDRTKNAKANASQHPPGTLLALNKEDGQVAWQRAEDIFGTTLAVSDKHQVLLMSYQDTRFKLASELGGQLAAFDALTGADKWRREASYKSRLTINDRLIYADGGAWDLVTGETQPFHFKRSYGCGVLSASKDMFFFRSATLGYFDLKNEQLENFGGVRPGCWINAIPAGGLVLVPDASAQCTCSYLNQTWFALEPLD